MCVCVWVGGTKDIVYGILRSKCCMLNAGPSRLNFFPTEPACSPRDNGTQSESLASCETARSRPAEADSAESKGGWAANQQWRRVCPPHACMQCQRIVEPTNLREM